MSPPKPEGHLASKNSLVDTSVDTSVRNGLKSPAAAIGRSLPLFDGPEQMAAITQASVESAASNEIVAVIPDFSFDAVAERVRPTF
jgi:hypothetical protein